MCYATCHTCGAAFDYPDAEIAWMPDDLRERYLGEVYCASCRSASAARSEEKARADELAETKRRLAERYDERLRESGIDVYALDYDPVNPEANRALMSWMLAHLDVCVWLVGESGKCKTRCIQAAAREAAKDRTVRYWPVVDLTAHLLEHAKRPESALWDIYAAELLVLEDLGKTTLTASRLSMLGAIIDRRYTGWDQTRRIQGGEEARFGLLHYVAPERRKLGGQLWITSQDDPRELADKLSAVDQADAAAIMRRIGEICVLHRV